MNPKPSLNSMEKCSCYNKNKVVSKNGLNDYNDKKIIITYFDSKKNTGDQEINIIPTNSTKYIQGEDTIGRSPNQIFQK